MNRTFLIKDLSNGKTDVWTVEQMLEEINRDRSSSWTNYTSEDFLEGWNEWVEGEPYYTLIGENKKFKVTATMDVGYTAIIEAPNKKEAWRIAAEDNSIFEQTDDGHDWTLENIRELCKKEAEDDPTVR